MFTILKEFSKILEYLPWVRISCEWPAVDQVNHKGVNNRSNIQLCREKKQINLSRH